MTFKTMQEAALKHADYLEHEAYRLVRQAEAIRECKHEHFTLKPHEISRDCTALINKCAKCNAPLQRSMDE